MYHRHHNNNSERLHHVGISVIYLAQNLFRRGKYSCDLSLNMDYIVLFKNVRDSSQIGHLARQMFPRIWAFQDATQFETE